MRRPPCPTEDERPLPAEEAMAREVMRHFIDADLIAPRQDPPDFLLCRTGTLAGGMEVTLGTDPSYEQVSSELSELPSNVVEAPSLSCRWIITFKQGGALRRLRRSGFRALIDVLKEEEDRILRGMSASQSSNQASQWLDLDLEGLAVLEQLGVRGAHIRTGHAGGGRLVVFTAGVAGYVTGDRVSELAEFEAGRKVDSLRAISGESHLFVWVRPWARFGAGLALRPDTDLPRLAPAIAGWVNVWLMSTDGSALWQVSDGRWYSHTPPNMSPGR